MHSDLKEALIKTFDGRVAFHKIERELYSSDIGYLPAVAKMQIKSLPDAVVQPKSVGELQELFELATKYSIPLVPRGAGTTGYGGVIPTKGEIGYWVGCNASFNQETRNLPVNSIRILNKAGIEPAYLAQDEWCCGGGVYSAGCINEIEDTFKHNMEEFHKRGIKTLITSCGSCFYYLGYLYPILAQQYGVEYNIKVRHITDFIDELIRQDKIKLKFPLKFSVTYHDPCHVSCAGGVIDAPRHILAAVPRLEVVEMPHHGADTLCCGRHTSRYPKYGNAVITRRLNEAFDTNIPAMVTGCPTCETNFRNALQFSPRSLEIFDITDIVAESMGLPTFVGARIKKIIKGQVEAGEKPEPTKVFLSEEELAKENNLFRPHNETYGKLHARKGSIKTISETLGESTDNTSVPKSC